MPREDQHRDRAERNEKFAESLDQSQPIHENWAVVAAFYAALHYVQAYFSRYSVEAATHDERFEQIKRDAKLRNVFIQYKYLYTLSRTARYQCSGLPAAAYSKEAKPNLNAVKTQIEHALKN
jgi:ABC-type anion transport system duplicated permease subunit